MNLMAKLQAIKERWLQMQEQLSDPELIKDMQRFKQLNKEYRDMEPVVHAFDKYALVVSNAENCRLLIHTEKDPELWAMAKEELALLEAEKESLEAEIKVLLIPKDPEDEKNAILEIRAGTGGDEAAIFVGDLLKMYSRYFDRQGWKTEVINASESEKGGYKEIVMEVEGS
ncbi:MAG: PCRF domain-containing protein, partial [Chitinophagales bacterium]